MDAQAGRVMGDVLARLGDVMGTVVARSDRHIHVVADKIAQSAGVTAEAGMVLAVGASVAGLAAAGLAVSPALRH